MTRRMAGGFHEIGRRERLRFLLAVPGTRWLNARRMQWEFE
jgi:hypothetical protein